MKVLIISDSHGWSEELEAVIERHKAEVEAIIHCGDSELAPSDRALEKVKVVAGNCDFNSDFPQERLEDIAGMRFYITHGHLHSVKNNLVKLSYRAEEVQAEVVCFGHTHHATCFQENGVTYINPGSLRLPARPKRVQIYCLCEINDEQIAIRFYERAGGEVEGLAQTFLR